MNKLIIWGVRVGLVRFVNKVLDARRDDVGKSINLVSSLIEKVEVVIAFLKVLRAKLDDYIITSEEADSIVEEAKDLMDKLNPTSVPKVTTPALALAASVVILAGCSTGMSVTLKDSTGVNVGNITLEGSTIPVVSYFSGPTFTAWFNKDYAPTVVIDGKASLTNATSALGIYNSAESKSLSISLASTNAPAASAKID